MKNLIAPALTFLVGLAMGALLWKNIGVDKPAQPNLENEFAIKRVISLFNESLHKGHGGAPLDYQQSLDSLTSNIASAYYSFDCRPVNSSIIKRKDAEDFVDNYLKFPTAMIRHICPDDGTTGTCNTSKHLFGWKVSYRDLITISKDDTTRVDSFYLSLARHDNGDIPGALTLVIAPSKNSDLLVEDNFLLEFMRPCPPRCPNKVNGRSVNRTSVNGTSVNDCLSNPYRAIVE